jgi:hypothetical protein
MTDSTLERDEIHGLQDLYRLHGIDQVLIALSELCGVEAAYYEQNSQYGELNAKRWRTLEGAIGCTVPHAGVVA